MATKLPKPKRGKAFTPVFSRKAAAGAAPGDDEAQLWVGRDGQYMLPADKFLGYVIHGGASKDVSKPIIGKYGVPKK